MTLSLSLPPSLAHTLALCLPASLPRSLCPLPPSPPSPRVRVFVHLLEAEESISMQHGGARGECFRTYASREKELMRFLKEFWALPKRDQDNLAAGLKLCFFWFIVLPTFFVDNIGVPQLS